MLFSLLIAFLLITLLIFIIFLISPKNTFAPNNYKKLNLPPSPPKLPLIGNLHQLSSLPHHDLHAMAKLHGPIMLLNLGQVKTLVLSSMEMAREVYKTQDLVFCGRPSLVVTNILFKNIDVAFAPYGEYWRQMKKVSVVHLLSSKMVQSFRLVREEEVAHIVKEISTSCGLGPINLTKMLYDLAKYVVSKVALGSSSREEEWFGPIDVLIPEAAKMMGAFSVGDYFPSLPWLNKITGVESKAKELKKSIDAILGKIVDKHINSSRQNEHGPKDLVDVLLALQKDDNLGQFITSDGIISMLMDTFGAGTDSTRIVMEWAISELIRNPRVMKKLKNEIMSIVGERAMVNEDDLKPMEYLRAVIKETMRLHPLGPLLLPKESIKDTKIDGYDIPKGARTFINIWSIGRDPNLWECPLEFKPERFVGSSIDFRGQDFELTPFGAGRRICPGIGFTIAIVELGLANIVHQFEWSLPDGMEKEILDMSEVLGITIRRRFDLQLIATPRFNIVTAN